MLATGLWEGVECGPQGSWLPLPFCCFPWPPSCWNATGWEFSRPGFFPVRATDCSWSPGTAPGWAEATGEGPGGCQGRPSSSALKASAQPPPSLEMQTSVSPLVRVWGNRGFWSYGAPGEVVGGLGDQRLHLSEERSWLWSHFLQPRLSHEGSGLSTSIPPSGGAVPARPRLSGPWRHQPW